MAMTRERFNELLLGPLNHPMVMFSVTRLALALWHVVDVTGDAGERALEEWCQGRQLYDESQEEADGEMLDYVEGEE